METSDIRNVALVGHGGAGKTTLNEAILFLGGKISRMGKVEEGNTVSDYEPEEVNHHLSMSTALSSVDHNNIKINILDTPGYADFIGDVKSAVKVSETVLLVLSAVGGVEVQSEITWDEAKALKKPTMLVVNKMDRENADFYKTVNEAQEKLSQNCIPVQLPIGVEADFSGIVDLIELKAYELKNGKASEIPVPDSLASEVDKYRDKLVDTVAEKDDALLEKYLDGQELTSEEIKKALRIGVEEATVFPVLCVSSTNLTGVEKLLDDIGDVAPSPEKQPVEALDAKDQEITVDLDKSQKPALFVFKTIADPFVGKLSLFKVVSGTIKHDLNLYNPAQDKPEKIAQLYFLQGKKQNLADEIVAGDIGAVAKLAHTHTGDTLCDKSQVIKVKPVDFPEPVLHEAIEAAAKADEEKLGVSLQKLLEEDLTFKVSRNVETHQVIVSGMGEMQIGIEKERLKRKFGVDSVLLEAIVPYRETIKGTAKVQGKYKKQSGGRGQYGDCWIEVSPLPKGEQFKFVDKIFGGSIPQNFRPAVEKGVKEAMEYGIVAGYPVVDIEVTLVDGSFHPVDSSEMAFKIAGSMALKSALNQAQPILLEPVDNVKVTVPGSYVGDVIGDVNSRRGKVSGMDPLGDGKTMVKAQIPASELGKYSIDLRSITGGRATFTREHSHYEEVPSHLVQKIVEKTKKE